MPRWLERLDPQYHLYRKGFSRDEIAVRRPYRIAGTFFFFVLLGAKWLSERRPNSSVWSWVFGLSFLGAMYCAFRASQRSKGSRTLLAVLAFLSGFALLLWTFWGFTTRGEYFGILTSPVVLVATGTGGAGLFYAAARLSHPSRAA
jgi:hypothetical protein